MARSDVVLLFHMEFAWFGKLKNRVVAAHRKRAANRELLTLTDAQLRDIGISRTDLDSAGLSSGVLDPLDPEIRRMRW